MGFLSDTNSPLSDTTPLLRDRMSLVARVRMTSVLPHDCVWGGSISPPAVTMGLHLRTALLPSPSDLLVFVPQGRRVRRGSSQTINYSPSPGLYYSRRLSLVPCSMLNSSLRHPVRSTEKSL